MINITAECHGATLNSAIVSDDLEKALARWSDVIEPESDKRAATLAMIADAMANNRHMDREGNEVVGNALLWMALTGDIGSKALPYVHAAPDRVTITCIISTEGTKNRFRADFDEATMRRMVL